MMKSKVISILMAVAIAFCTIISSPCMQNKIPSDESDIIQRTEVPDVQPECDDPYDEVDL